MRGKVKRRRMAVTQKGLIGKTDTETIRQNTEAACLPVTSSLPSNSRGKRNEKEVMFIVTGKDE